MKYISFYFLFQLSSNVIFCASFKKKNCPFSCFFLLLLLFFFFFFDKLCLRLIFNRLQQVSCSTRCETLILFSFQISISMVLNVNMLSKKSTCNAGNLSSIPGLGRYPGEENGCLLQYSCLENSMDREDWQATVHRVTVGHD